ncbi:hypothetical protein [Prosthecobacter sp.]|uniref:hypothetical protein n=1 Tax=Prosthecobacter sp. TaxID=1965333 RepID=UPI003782E234
MHPHPTKKSGCAPSPAPPSGWQFHFRSVNFDYDVFVSSSAVRIYRDSPDRLPKIASSKS